MAKYRIRLYNSIVGILWCGMILPGCVNLEAVGQFANGTKALSDASATFYDKSLETDRQLAMLSVDLNTSYKSPECQDKNGIYLSPWDCAVRGKNLLSETRRNLAAVATLAQYARSLNDIASFNDDAKVQNAAKDLSNNLNNIANTLNISMNAEESALANAISSVAKIYIDLKASDVVYEKAKQAQEPVTVIINTLKNDIKRQQQRININRINAKATREEWFNALRTDYQNPNTAAAGRAALSIAAGHLVEDELIDLVEELPNKQFLANFERTVDSCLAAHIAIQNPDYKDKANTVKHFVNDAKTLLSSAKRLVK